MPPGTPREARETREARGAGEAREARLAAETRLSREGRQAEETIEFRLAPESRAAREARLAAETRLSRERRQAREAEEIVEFRLAPESRAARQARLAAETRLSTERRQATGVPETVEFRLAPESRTAREARERVRRAAQDMPELVLNRATTLLACICLLRYQRSDWDDHHIARLLRDSFPDISIHYHDVDVLFHATCRNRSRWVLEMRNADSVLQRAMGRELEALLQTNTLAHLPQLPQERYHDRREAIRYLHDLLEVHDEDDTQEFRWAGSQSM